jgi:hypothetical protein
MKGNSMPQHIVDIHAEITRHHVLNDGHTNDMMVFVNDIIDFASVDSSLLDSLRLSLAFSDRKGVLIELKALQTKADSIPDGRFLRTMEDVEARDRQLIAEVAINLVERWGEI